MAEDKTLGAPQRKAEVFRSSLAAVESCLPENYTAQRGEEPGQIVIVGYDEAGCTLDDNVIPRLASRLITAKEVWACECEHGSHFEPDGYSERTHAPGALMPTRAVRITTFGAFRICKDCSDAGHMPGDVTVESIHR